MFTKKDNDKIMERINAFLKEQRGENPQGRYEPHISDEMLAHVLANLIQQNITRRMYYENSFEENVARVTGWIFELVLECHLNVRGSGQKQTYALAALFKDFTLENPPQPLEKGEGIFDHSTMD